MELNKIIHAVLFAATKPLTAAEIAQNIRRGSATTEGLPYTDISTEEVEKALADFGAGLGETPIHLDQISGGYRLATKPDFSPWVLGVGLQDPKPVKLSQPALETLAVIAYRQPISRAEIEAVRGVAVGGVLETLLDREVIRVAGRADVPGRPLIYETTPLFLEHFGLRDLNDLPNGEELKRVKLPEPPATNEEQQELIHEPAADPQAD